MVHAKRRDSYNIDMNYILYKCFVSVHLNALSVCIFNTYEYVTDVLHMRTVERKRNSYICVWVSHVEFNTCANNTKSSHPIKLQRKIDKIVLCRPDVATDQDLHCLPLICSMSL